VLETYRECLQDVFDLPELTRLLRDVRSRAVRVVEVETELPSPFASSLQLSYVSAFMYEGDAPLAERRAQALALDRAVLAELMGREELRELPRRRRARRRRAAPAAHLRRSGRRAIATGLHDLLRDLGDLDAARSRRAAATTPRRRHGWQRWSRSGAREGARRRRRALDRRRGCGALSRCASGGAAARDCRARSSSRSPIRSATSSPATPARTGRSPPQRRRPASARDGGGPHHPARLAAQGRVVEGEFRPGRQRPRVGRYGRAARLRRRSLAVLRREIEPVSPEALVRFAPTWHDVAPSGPRHAGLDALWRAVEQLQGVPLPASALEGQILRARIPDYSPVLLDQLGATGELVWAGAGALGAADGWIVLAQAELAPLLLPSRARSPVAARAAHARRARRGGALFFRQLSDLVGGPPTSELVRRSGSSSGTGRVTNDTLAPLRAVCRGVGSSWRGRRCPRPDARRRRASLRT
jgi:ATP-dependent Lhr-like helicase